MANGWAATNGGNLVGVLSERDILSVSTSALLPHTKKQDQFLQQRFHVRDVMVRDVVTVSPDTGLKKAATLLLRQRLGCLPVVDVDNKLVGIVSSSDFLRLAAKLLPDE